ncbi:hypothetical protein M059_04410 [Streptococcus mitis 18/56]|uniref:Uncharacterized protein n=1 Tax=Streptococcus mitis 18/56 TaxID=1340485 RepID=S7Z5Q1_STRMT|nr:hypothetical protein M059_04410 [Streptococcus mitis 18/56]
MQWKVNFLDIIYSFNLYYLFRWIYQATKKSLDPEKYDVWEQFVNSDHIHLLYLISKHRLLVYFLEQ